MELCYDPDLSPELIHELERAARWTGLPLRDLELLGQQASTARRFVQAFDQGEHEAFLGRVDWHRLEARLRSRTAPAPVKRRRLVTS